MANTADILGEQETLDGLISHTLEEFEDDKVNHLCRGCFKSNYGLKTVNLPNYTESITDTINSLSQSDKFDGCLNLETFSAPLLKAIRASEFSNCYKLKNLTLSNEKIRLGSSCFVNCFSLNDLSNLTFESVSSNSLSGIGAGFLSINDSSAAYTFVFSNSRISVLDLIDNGSTNNFYSTSLNDMTSLVHLIIRRDKQVNISGSASLFLNNTPIKNGLGWIYVPSELVDTYKTATNWSIFANQIVSLDEYPKALSGETITDSWDEIFQAENDGSYKTKYGIGDTKYLVIGGTYVLMQIIAFDRDILSSDHTSTAKITWLAKSLSFRFPMNFENVIEGGWADCECRKFLSDTIYGQIPENVRNKIVAVDKTYTATSSSSSTATVSDKLWIPSAREIYGGSSYENTGIDYTDFFTGSSVRMKNNGLLTNSAYGWWLRTVNGSKGFCSVSPSGVVSFLYASSPYGLALGFCT